MAKILSALLSEECQSTHLAGRMDYRQPGIRSLLRNIGVHSQYRKAGCQVISNIFSQFANVCRNNRLPGGFLIRRFGMKLRPEPE
jgi:hypothetical protein